MRVLLPILVLLAALAALLMVPSEKPIFGMSHSAFGGASLGAAMLVFLTASGALRIGPSAIARVVGSALIWALVIVLLAEVYTYRSEFADIGARMLEDLIPSEPTVGQGGEVIIKSRFGGEFVVPAKVNDRPVSFVFDTGATNVVLTAEDAAASALICASSTSGRRSPPPTDQRSPRRSGSTGFRWGPSWCATFARWSPAPARCARACSA